MDDKIQYIDFNEIKNINLVLNKKIKKLNNHFNKNKNKLNEDEKTSYQNVLNDMNNNFFKFKKNTKMIEELYKHFFNNKK